MFCSYFCVVSCLLPVLFQLGTCALDIPRPPFLSLYSPHEPEYTDVLVRRVGDNLTLVCELQGDQTPRHFVWNFFGGNNTEAASPFTTQPAESSSFSHLIKTNLTQGDSGHYMCSSVPFSVTKFILVQTRGPKQCARGAFWCGKICVLASYVCDGFTDCRDGADEAPSLCTQRPCDRADKLNCSSSRCISASACCRARVPPNENHHRCIQPACCDEHARYSPLDLSEYKELEYPPLFEDRRAPDEYGFIQSTIYTVTACALIFMIAVVLLVSAICKMHMKRAALRGYAHADRAARHHYNMQYAQAARFPPCYEASRLLQQAQTQASAPSSPTRPPLQCTSECGDASPCEDTAPEPHERGFGLSRLSSLFSTRYRQVPTSLPAVEMQSVRRSSIVSSPANRSPRRAMDYRSPTYTDLNTDVFFDPEMSSCGRELNYMSTPLEMYQRRALRDDLSRVLDARRARPLTLQLGRFQLSIPRLGRSTTPRPDTPNIAEVNIDDLDFIRNNDTYTLNGRTIRLLGANFENLNDNINGNRPPTYTDAMGYKLYGPPPEYLSRDDVTENATPVTPNEQEARGNVEMPPCYEDLASGGNNVGNLNGTVNGNDEVNNGNVRGGIDTDGGSNANVTVGNGNVEARNLNAAVGNFIDGVGNIHEGASNVNDGVSNVNLAAGNVYEGASNGNSEVSNNVGVSNANVMASNVNVNNVNVAATNVCNDNNNMNFSDSCRKSNVTNAVSNIIDNRNGNSSITDNNSGATSNAISNVNDSVNGKGNAIGVKVTKNGNVTDNATYNVNNNASVTPAGITSDTINSMHGANRNDSIVENLSSVIDNLPAIDDVVDDVIDNLPAIDSDVNANETRYNELVINN